MILQQPVFLSIPVWADFGRKAASYLGSFLLRIFDEVTNAGLFEAALLTLRAALRAFCDAGHLVNRFQRFLLTNVRQIKKPCCGMENIATESSAAAGLFGALLLTRVAC